MASTDVVNEPPPQSLMPQVNWTSGSSSIMLLMNWIDPTIEKCSLCLSLFEVEGRQNGGLCFKKLNGGAASTRMK